MSLEEEAAAFVRGQLKLDRLTRIEESQKRIEGKLDALMHLLAEDDEESRPVVSLDGASTANPRDQSEGL